MIKAELGIIGGSGTYSIEGLKIIAEFDIKTPFGKPSDPIKIGTFDGKTNIAFIARHGKGHRLSPTEIPSKANIFAMKLVGVKHLIAISAVGSLKEELKPTDVVIPDQIIDRTKHRSATFFSEGIVGHVAFGEPFCPALTKFVKERLDQIDVTVHPNGTYVCMEGPAFSTKAESNLYRSWDASIIGMTAIPEAKLAREAEMSYVIVAMVTDYDCWYEEEEDVNVSMVEKYMTVNGKTISKLVKKIGADYETNKPATPFENSSEFAIMTAKEAINKKTMKILTPLFGKYWNK